MRNRKHDGNKSSVVNFGVQGWVTILYCLLMFWLYAGMVNSGSNVTAPAIAEKFGILPGTVLNMNTVAGVVGVIFFIVVGQINRVIGARITSGVCLIVAGLAYLGVGNAVNLAMYTVCMCIVVGGVMSAGYISGGDLVTQWFPKKKGIVMGYTTMGHNLASVAFVPLITLLVGRLGIGNGVIPISVCAIVLGILGLLLVRNTPQERGLNPDNVSEPSTSTAMRIPLAAGPPADCCGARKPGWWPSPPACSKSAPWAWYLKWCCATWSWASPGSRPPLSSAW